MEEVTASASARPWEQPPNAPAGLKRKVLRTGPDGKPRVALLRLEPGFEMDAHTHEHAENHYVLEGMYESHGKEYAAGTYRWIPKRAAHGPFRSHGGALLLVVWER